MVAMPAHRKYQLEVGQVIGWGTVIDPDIRMVNGRGATLRCRCGREYTAYLTHLMKTGNVKSCGCAKKITSAENGRKTADAQRTHGLSGSRIYNTWIQMMDRCHNKNSKDYHRYGGRGIVVCQEWHDVKNFANWTDRNLGVHPIGWSIDRIDNDGNYEPGNVRWASPKMQASNRRKTVSWKTKKCVICEKEFSPTGPAAKFCSVQCRDNKSIQ